MRHCARRNAYRLRSNSTQPEDRSQTLCGPVPAPARGFCFGEIPGETKWYIDWDRTRLRSLLTRAEFVEVCRLYG